MTDDHADSAEYLVRLLRKSGYQARSFSCAPDVLKQLESEKPELLILDVMMPDMTGLECLQKIRTDLNLTDIPVIIYSADFTFETMDQARKTGANEFIVKGAVKWPDFQRIVRKYIGEPKNEEVRTPPPLE